MTEQKVRQPIRCWKCGEVFTLLIDVAGEPELSLTCLYCSAPIQINLAQSPSTVSTVWRLVDKVKPPEHTAFVLPDIIESQEPTNL